MAASQEAILLVHNLGEFGVTCSEELEVNQWIALDIPSLSSQSEHVKNTIHCFSKHLNLSLFSTIAIIIFTPFIIILSLKYFLLLQDKEVSYGAHAPRILALDDYFLMEVEKTEKDPDTGKKIKKKVWTLTL